MTAVAFFTVAAGVLVLNAVARHTRQADALVFLTGVAGRAGDLTMRGDQGEFRLRMIERFRTTPALLGVAALAVGTEATLVRLLGPMTVDATARRRAEFLLRPMATIATR